MNRKIIGQARRAERYGLQRGPVCAYADQEAACQSSSPYASTRNGVADAQRTNTRRPSSIWARLSICDRQTLGGSRGAWAFGS